MKRIVICCDGTWNAPDEKEGDALSTNVVKMAHAVCPIDDAAGVHQVVYYHRGVGTNWGADHLVGGALGIGLSNNIEDAYRFLVDNYVNGDELYLFGFSRGAYTARSLAGLIRNCGILKKVDSDKIHRAYEIYRSKGEADAPDAQAAQEFLDQHSKKVDKIKFIGVWDTVGALGIPGLLHFVGKELFEFHDVKLSSIIENAYHALAIDERRQPFQPSLWEKDQADEHQTMEQVWFAGVHSNVGGGYSECGLSDIAFDWMAKKARACGLALDQAYIDRHIKPDCGGQLRDSLTLFYRLFGNGQRSLGGNPKTNEKLHQSVVDRLERNDPRYRPANIGQQLNLDVVS